MTAIMSLEEPRPRETAVGQRADRRRVSEAENFFRCNICGGYLDARDYVWVLDHEGPLPHPAQDLVQQQLRTGYLRNLSNEAVLGVFWAPGPF